MFLFISLLSIGLDPNFLIISYFMDPDIDNKEK